MARPNPDPTTRTRGEYDPHLHVRVLGMFRQDFPDGRCPPWARRAYQLAQRVQHLQHDPAKLLSREEAFAKMEYDRRLTDAEATVERLTELLTQTAATLAGTPTSMDVHRVRDRLTHALHVSTPAAITPSKGPYDDVQNETHAHDPAFRFDDWLRRTADDRL